MCPVGSIIVRKWPNQKVLGCLVLFFRHIYIFEIEIMKMFSVRLIILKNYFQKIYFLDKENIFFIVFISKNMKYI